MKKGWRVIGAVVLIAVILGAVCIGVGILTGADTNRIYSVIDNKYNLEIYRDYFQRVIQAFRDAGVICLMPRRFSLSCFIERPGNAVFCSILKRLLQRAFQGSVNMQYSIATDAFKKTVVFCNIIRI